MKHSLGPMRIDRHAFAIALTHHARHGTHRRGSSIGSLFAGLARGLLGTEPPRDLLTALPADDADRGWVAAVAATCDELRRRGRRLALADCEREQGPDGFCNVVLFDRSHGQQIRPGDVVFAGAQVLRAPATGVVVAPRQLRQICSNGSLVDAGCGTGFEVEPHAVADALETCLSPDGFAIAAERLRWSAVQVIDDVDALLDAAAVATEREPLVRAFRAGSDHTLFGLVNAATSLAHAERDPARRLDRERDAERLLAASERSARPGERERGRRRAHAFA